MWEDQNNIPLKLFKPKSPLLKAFASIILYIFLIFLFWGNAQPIANSIMIFIVIVFFIAYFLLQADRRITEKETNIFKKIAPFKEHGLPVSNFQYTFISENEKTLEESTSGVFEKLKEYMEFSEVETKHIIDIDPALAEDDEREFLISKSRETNREGKITFIVKKNRISKVYSIRWWFLLSGTIAPISVFVFIVCSPITIFSWLIPRLRGVRDLAIDLTEVYPADYEKHDLLVILNSANKVAYETLISQLKAKDIEVTDLEARLKNGYIDFSNLPELQ